MRGDNQLPSRALEPIASGHHQTFTFRFTFRLAGSSVWLARHSGMRFTTKKSTRTLVLYLAFCVLLTVAIFCKPLGLTKFVPAIVMKAGAALIGVALVASQWLDARRARLSPVAQAKSAPAPRSRMWIAIGLCAIVSICGPFWWPLTGGDLAHTSLTLRVVSSAVAFAASTAIIVFAFRGSRR
jgi:hypothetical protein